MPTEVYRFQVGALRCVAINDGYISGISVPGFFPNAPVDEFRQVLHRHGIASDTFAAPCICLVVDTGTHRVLVDTGGGKGHPGYGMTFSSNIPVKPDLGRLMDGLAQEGIAPESIDSVILSHAHVDHVSGVANSAGKPAFPNARYIMARGEWEEFISQQIPDQDDDWVHVFHFPFPGLGHMIPDGDGWRYEPKGAG